MLRKETTAIRRLFKSLFILLLIVGCVTKPEYVHPLIGTWRWCGLELADHSISYFEGHVTWTFYETGQMYEVGTQAFNTYTREWIWTTNENNELDSLIQTKENGYDRDTHKWHIDHYEIIEDSLKISSPLSSIYCKE